MIFPWLDTSTAKAFGNELAQFYIVERSKFENDMRRKMTFEKMQKELLLKISLRAKQFKLTNSLNLLKRSQAINVFKWHLLDAGYDKQFVDELSHWVLLQL